MGAGGALNLNFFLFIEGLGRTVAPTENEKNEEGTGQALTLLGWNLCI